MDSFTIESLKGEVQTVNDNQHAHRMYEEFAVFDRVIQENDQEFVKQQLMHSKIVMEIVEAALEDAKIHLG